MSTKALIILLMVFNGFVAAGGQLFMKSGMNEIAKFTQLTLSEYILKIVTTPLVLLGIATYGISLTIWLFVLSKVDLSFAYALVAFTYVFLLIFSKFFLHENLSIIRLLGSALIIAGIIFVTRS